VRARHEPDCAYPTLRTRPDESIKE